MKNILRPALAALIGTAIFLAVLFGRGILSAQGAQESVRTWSDAFAVPGVLLFLSGAFVWIVRQGTFSGMGYAIRQIWVSLHSRSYREEHMESYSEYRERKLGGEKSPFLFLLVVGALFLLPAVALSIVYFFV